jgi:hypothetical protein
MKKSDLYAQIQFLEQRVAILERENAGTTNALYEIENRLQSQLDALTNYTMLTREKVEKIDGE